MTKPKELKILVFTNSTDIKQEIRDMLEGKVLRLTFSDLSSPSRMPKPFLKRFDSFHIVVQMSDETVLLLQAYPELDRKVKGRAS